VPHRPLEGSDNRGGEILLQEVDEALAGHPAATRLAAFKVPRRIVFLESLSRNITGSLNDPYWPSSSPEV
jgi:hypothetical protein